MTDRDLVRELCKRLGLKKTGSVGTGTPCGADEYLDDGEYIIIGQGDGYSGFQVSFTFDDADRLKGHTVFE